MVGRVKFPQENFNCSIFAVVDVLALILVVVVGSSDGWTCNKIVSLSFGMAIYSVNCVYDHEFVGVVVVVVIADRSLEGVVVGVGSTFIALLGVIVFVELVLLLVPVVLVVLVVVVGSKVAK